MRSFKDYQPNNSSKNGQTTGAGTSANGFEATFGAEDTVRKIAEAYEGKSGMEMMRNILAEAESAKRNGTLTNEQIDGFYAQFAPMLNASQRKKLQEIVNKLKEI